MGLCLSREATAQDVSRHKAVARDLNTRKAELAKEIKMLLLGAGESGKSTIFKQMKIIHHNGYDQEECMLYKKIIHSNTLQCIKNLISACEKFGIQIEDEENRERAHRIARVESETLQKIEFTQALGQDISHLWKDPGIQQAYNRRGDFQLLDSAEYYLDNVMRIADPAYVPTEQDVLRSRVKTTGIIETTFTRDGMIFKMVDVGGQRNERKKWIHCFEGVDALIFVTSLSEYDQKCYEDDTTNRMQESLSLWEDHVNSRWFANASIILLFNKTDLFRKKIEKKGLAEVFPDYKGDKDFDSATSYIAKKFQDKFPKDRQLFTHFTCATDTEAVKNVFNVLQQQVQEHHMNRTKML